jgi:putative membrane protein
MRPHYEHAAGPADHPGCHDGRMTRFLIRLVINAVALWLMTGIVGAISPGKVVVVPFPPGDTLALVVTYLLVALVFGIVNGIVGNLIRVVAFPIYILTLGLISFIVNGLLLLLVAWLTGLFGFGLQIESFWWGVLGAFVLGVIAWLLGIVTRPLTRRDDQRG